jgi:hypothetical protein
MYHRLLMTMSEIYVVLSRETVFWTGYAWRKKIYSRARIFKLLRSPRINFMESIPPSCVAWRIGTATLFLLGS